MSFEHFAQFNILNFNQKGVYSVKVLFVDDRLDEIMRQWQESGCDLQHELLPLEPFDSIERTSKLVQALSPDVIVIGHGLSCYPITGVDVIRALREQGYTGYVIANSGGGAELFANANVEVNGNVGRRGQQLQQVFQTLSSSKG